MRRLIQVTQDDDSAEARLSLPARRALRREAALLLHEARTALDQKIFDAPPRAEGRACRTRQRATKRCSRSGCSRPSRAYIAATKFKKYERMDEVLFKLAYLLTFGEEGGPGA